MVQNVFPLYLSTLPWTSLHIWEISYPCDSRETEKKHLPKGLNTSESTATVEFSIQPLLEILETRKVWEDIPGKHCIFFVEPMERTSSGNPCGENYLHLFYWNVSNKTKRLQPNACTKCGILVSYSAFATSELFILNWAIISWLYLKDTDFYSSKWLLLFSMLKNGYSAASYFSKLKFLLAVYLSSC